MIKYHGASVTIQPGLANRWIMELGAAEAQGDQVPVIASALAQPAEKDPSMAKISMTLSSSICYI
jgi:hypothetical protein